MSRRRRPAIVFGELLALAEAQASELPEVEAALQMFEEQHPGRVVQVFSDLRDASSAMNELLDDPDFGLVLQALEAPRD